MPNLPRPRLRRTRAGELVAPLPPEPQAQKVEEIAAEGLRWIKIDRPGAVSGYSGMTMEMDATNTVGPEDAEPPSPQTPQKTRRRARRAASA